MSEKRFSLTAAQLGIWLGQALDPRSTAYWAAECIELGGPLDVRAFERAHHEALCEVEALHLRFGFGETGPEQWACEERRAPLVQLDFRSAGDPPSAARAWMAGSLAAPADLGAGPLFESALLQVANDRHFWSFRAHHIALDGYGFQLVQARVAARYAAEVAGPVRAAAVPAPALVDLVREDRRYRASQAFVRDREFWLERLKQAPAAASLMPIKPLARTTRHERGAPDRALLARVTGAARALEVDVPSWLNAAVMTWLARELGGAGCTLGIPLAGRLGSVAASLPCMAMNIVPLARCWREATTFEELSRSVRDEQRACRLHQRYRYEDLRQDLAAGSGPQRPFGVVVNWMPFEALQFAQLATKKLPLSAGPVEDLAVAFSPGPEGLRVDLEANPSAYDAATLSRCRQALLETMALVAAEPRVAISALPRSDSTQQPLSILCGEPLAQTPPSLLGELERFAERTPDAIAIEQRGRESLSYAALLRSVRQLAAGLASEGVRASDRVAVLMPRSREAVAAQLAILWLGAAYVPLDPRGPGARTRAVLDDARPRLVLTWGPEPELTSGFSCFPLERAALGAELAERATVDDRAAAYIIYTSGSTGKPNGVAVSRGALWHFIAAAKQRYAFSARDRVLQFAPLAFDASVEEIMLTLGSGGTLVLRSEAMNDSLSGFLREVSELKLSVLDLPTAFFHELVLVLDAERTLPASVRLVIIGGEAALVEHVARFRRYAPPSALLLNTYGPTETTVVCTTAALAFAGAPPLGAEVPIGAPLPGLSIAVVDAQRRPVAIGGEGQLCVLGPTLANGYWGREALTADRFVSLERLPGAPRAYLTGDRARLDPDGSLMYLGRLDEELKISGYRVSPLEVEAALMSLGSVREAAVVALGRNGSQQLAAFVVSCEPEPEASSVRAQLSEHVARAALPRHVCFLERLPRDPNGKIARSVLRARVPMPDGPRDDLVASPAERQVAEVWREVLGVAVSDLDADFFALGGHSLLALRVAHRLGSALGRDVPLSALFQHPTVRSLTASLTAAEGARAAGPHPLAARVELSSSSGPPLFCLPPADGLSWCYVGLSRHLPRVALLGLQAPGLRGVSPTDYEALVDYYLEQVLAAQPAGPYRLLGWSSGGGLAHSLAARLEARGEAIALIALLDAYPAEVWQGKPLPTEVDAWIMMLDAADAAEVNARATPPTASELLELVKQPGRSLAGFDEATLARMSEVALASMIAYRGARHPKLRAPVTFFRAAERGPAAPEPALWSPYVGALEVIDVPASHLQMCSPVALAAIAAVIAPRL